MGDRQNRVRRQVYSISVPIDGDRTVVDYFRHRWQHEEMMDSMIPIWWIGEKSMRGPASLLSFSPDFA